MIRVLLATVLALALGACASLGLRAKGPPTAAERGHALAESICAACHAVEPGAATPAGAPPAFASREMQHVAGLEGRVETLTREGHHAMPPQHLTPDQVADLVVYIGSLTPTKGEPTLNERPRELPVRPRG
ncbi:MAG TPA: c-type cytochrome [Phenylobacterium sp.]|nr:c-type cytochrome [Phenylobacterium sp.]